MQLTDEELIKKLNAADRLVSNEAYKYIIINYKQKVCGYLRNKGCVDSGMLETVWQDTLCALEEFRREKELYLKAGFVTILIGFAKRIWWRKMDETKKEETFINIDDYIEKDNNNDENVKDEFVLPEFIYNDENVDESEGSPSEVVRIIRLALKKLTGKHCREIYEMKYFYHVNQQEIADELGIKRESVSEIKNGRCKKELEMLLRSMGIRISKIKNKPDAGSAGNAASPEQEESSDEPDNL